MLEDEKQTSKAKWIVIIAACIIIAVIFLISGTGKLAPSKEGWALPGQTMDFIARLFPTSWIMSDTFMWFYNDFIPVAVPTVELMIAVFLLLGFIPRFWAIITMLMTLVFIADNSYAIYIGTAKFTSCSCFGVWEKIFGGLTPVQSLVIDIIMFVLALLIFLWHPGGIFQSRKWLSNLGKKKIA
jgi:uncharacterized membrane protein YphA (DoxX/SURF4 family)